MSTRNQRRARSREDAIKQAAAESVQRSRVVGGREHIYYSVHPNWRDEIRIDHLMPLARKCLTGNMTH